MVDETMASERKAGVSRDQEMSDEGLQRLSKQLQFGARMSDRVLKQWIKRYGDDARVIIAEHRSDFKGNS